MRRGSFLVILAALVSGCASFPVIGQFHHSSEVFRGTFDKDLLADRRYIRVQGEATKLICEGNAWLTHSPPGSLCSGRSGDTELFCADGRLIRAKWKAYSCTSGMGSGTDDKGNKFTFAYSMNEEEASSYVQAAVKSKERREEKEKASSAGTGFFVTSDGYILTNYHVIQDKNQITVITPDRREYAAKLIKSDPPNDLALIKIDAQAVPIPLNIGGSALKGEEVLTIGYPLLQLTGTEQKATFGRVNALSGLQGDVRFFQVDVPLQPGNSGGPLINSRGELVGVVTAVLTSKHLLETRGVVAQNVNYAVKLDYIVPLLKWELGDKWKPETVMRSKKEMTDLVRMLQPSVALIIAE